MKLKAITFVEPGKDAEGYFFYQSTEDFQEGHIAGLKDLTLSNAVAVMQKNSVNPIDNFKITIAVYPT